MLNSMKQAQTLVNWTPEMEVYGFSPLRFILRLFSCEDDTSVELGYHLLITVFHWGFCKGL